jgi:CheY-like chemotaxis protein
VADDEPAVLRLLDMALRQAGFAVWQASNGAEAIALYRRHAEHIDLVLLDVQMPGTDGPDTWRALQELNPALRCCFMSGYTGQYKHEGLIGLGALQVLDKPFNLGALAATLHQLSGLVSCP